MAGDLLMAIDPVQWLMLHAEKIGLLTVAGGIILSLIKGWIVTGREYQKAIADCEYHKSAHARLQEQLERSLNVSSMIATVSHRVVERPSTTRSRRIDQSDQEAGS